MFNRAGKSINELLISGWELQMLVINILTVEIQLFFMSLVMVTSHVRMMIYILLTMFIVKFCRFLFKIFIYSGLRLARSRIGCGIINFVRTFF